MTRDKRFRHALCEVLFEDNAWLFFTPLATQAPAPLAYVLHAIGDYSGPDTPGFDTEGDTL